MGRALRVESADAFFHAFSRGNEWRDVFHDDHALYIALLQKKPEPETQGGNDR